MKEIILTRTMTYNVDNIRRDIREMGGEGTTEEILDYITGLADEDFADTDNLVLRIENENGEYIGEYASHARPA